MEFNIEKLSELERKIFVEIPQDNIKAEIHSKLQKLAKKVKLDGFRPGKIPLEVVKERYGKGVHEEVINDLMKSSLQKAILEAKVDLATMPTIGELSDTDGLKFSATFEVKPKIKFTDLSEIKFTKYEAEIKDEDIDFAILEFRKQQIDWQESEESVKDGMKVEVDFVGKIGNEEFAGGSGEDVPFVIGAGSMLEEFEQGVIGLQKNESKNVQVTFPDSYHAKELAGKKANFTITLKKSFNPVLPEVDSKFMEKYGEKTGSMEKFRDKIRNNLNVQLQQHQNILFQEEVFHKFADVHDIDLPKGMIDQEMSRINKGYIENLKQHGRDVKELELPSERFADKAKQQVKLTLLVTEFVIQNKLTVDEQKVSEKIALIASTYADPESVAKWFYSDKGQLDKIKSQVLEGQVVDNIANQSKVEIENLSYNEIMKK